MEVAVEARMWSWAFTYPGGKRSAVLVAPVGGDVKLSMTSRDVIHSFYVPALRIKMDTVPGLTTTAWFNASAPGESTIWRRYCALKHAKHDHHPARGAHRGFRRGGGHLRRDRLPGPGAVRDYGARLSRTWPEARREPAHWTPGRRWPTWPAHGRKERVTVTRTTCPRPAGARGEIARLRSIDPSYQDLISGRNLEARSSGCSYRDTPGRPPGPTGRGRWLHVLHSTDGSYIAGRASGADRFHAFPANRHGGPARVRADDAYLPSPS